MSVRTVLTLGLLFVATGICPAQSININFGTLQLSEAYAAAGAPGVWNVTPGNQGTSYPLVDLNGAPTAATFSNIGGTAIQQQVLGNTPAGRMLRQYLVTFTPTLEVCIFVNGLQNGTYKVITYAFLDGGPDSLVSVDQSTQANELVGGVWSGALEDGVTHTIHTATVTNGTLGLHSGIPAGGTPAVAALNAVQIIRVTGAAFQRGDANKDGTTNIADAVQILQGLFAGPLPDTCPDASDTNDDGSVNIADPVALLARLFGGAAALPYPFHSCGYDVSSDALPCTAFPCP